MKTEVSYVALFSCFYWRMKRHKQNQKPLELSIVSYVLFDLAGLLSIIWPQKRWGRRINIQFQCFAVLGFGCVIIPSSPILILDHSLPLNLNNRLLIFFYKKIVLFISFSTRRLFASIIIIVIISNKKILFHLFHFQPIRLLLFIVFPANHHVLSFFFKLILN